MVGDWIGERPMQWHCCVLNTLIRDQGEIPVSEPLFFGKISHHEGSLYIYLPEHFVTAPTTD